MADLEKKIVVTKNVRLVQIMAFFRAGAPVSAGGQIESVIRRY
ncbi:MAG: hypothetical protein SPF70_05965 [Lachnospiraceae bacterium]|nr:hypothetical protein [Lachnospiraceae bacterium]